MKTKLNGHQLKILPNAWLGLISIFPLLMFFTGLGMAEKILAKESQKIRVLIITGGHQFEREAFFQMFDSFTDIQYQEKQHPGANDAFFPETADSFDVFVFYDMYEEITEEQKLAFLNLLKKGKGMVFLHHSLLSYQGWEAFEKIIGGRYHRQANANHPASTYQHDVDFMVHVVDTSHPVTRGMKDFLLHDEIYGHFSVSPDVQPLLITDHPASGKIIAWTHRYGNSRIVYIQPGHDHSAYNNQNYRRMILNAIRWVSGIR